MRFQYFAACFLLILLTFSLPFTANERIFAPCTNMMLSVFALHNDALHCNKKNSSQDMYFLRFKKGVVHILRCSRGGGGGHGFAIIATRGRGCLGVCNIAHLTEYQEPRNNPFQNESLHFELDTPYTLPLYPTCMDSLLNKDQSKEEQN